MGSNSVNVFLGLGIPWVIASIYYGAQGEDYHVPAGNLSFSVALYLAVWVGGITFLFFKRWYEGGELGGKSTFSRWGSWVLLFILWCIYLIFSTLKEYNGV